jgi:transposase
VVLEETQDTEEIIERVAALDIGKAEVVCCIRVPREGSPGRRMQEVATYPTMTRSLLGMCDRLRCLGVTRVVMEATSDYWRPAFYLLEAAGFARRPPGLSEREPQSCPLLLGGLPHVFHPRWLSAPSRRR